MNVGFAFAIIALVIAGAIVLWIWRETRLDRQYLEQCRRNDEEFERRSRIAE